MPLLTSRGFNQFASQGLEAGFKLALQQIALRAEAERQDQIQKFQIEQANIQRQFAGEQATLDRQERTADRDQRAEFEANRGLEAIFGRDVERKRFESGEKLQREKMGLDFFLAGLADERANRQFEATERRGEREEDRQTELLGLQRREAGQREKATQPLPASQRSALQALGLIVPEGTTLQDLPTFLQAKGIQAESQSRDETRNAQKSEQKIRILGAVEESIQRRKEGLADRLQKLLSETAERESQLTGEVVRPQAFIPGSPLYDDVIAKLETEIANDISKGASGRLLKESGLDPAEMAREYVQGELESGTIRQDESGRFVTGDPDSGGKDLIGGRLAREKVRQGMESLDAAAKEFGIKVPQVGPFTLDASSETDRIRFARLVSGSTEYDPPLKSVHSRVSGRTITINGKTVKFPANYYDIFDDPTAYRALALMALGGDYGLPTPAAK
mgnify:CR=1 FL=1